MTRILSSPFARFVILLALSHPLSGESRSIVIGAMEERLSRDPSALEESLLSSEQLERNETKDALKLLCHTENQRIPLLLLLILRNLVCTLNGDAFFDHPASSASTVSFNITGKILECLECLCQVSSDLKPLFPVISTQLEKEVDTAPPTEPPAGEHRSWKKSKIAKSSYPQKFVITSDFLLPPSLFLLQTMLPPSFLSSTTVLDSLGKVLRSSCLYSLTSIQV